MAQACDENSKVIDCCLKPRLLLPPTQKPGQGNVSGIPEEEEEEGAGAGCRKLWVHGPPEPWGSGVAGGLSHCPSPLAETQG